MKLKGYIFSRPFMGERVPQHIQNIVIRNYCSNNNHVFFLSASEYTMDKSSHILKQIVDSSENFDGIVAYSLFQMPEDLSIRNKIFDKMISKNKIFIFAVENMILKTSNDKEKINEIWEIKKNLSNALTDFSQIN